MNREWKKITVSDLGRIVTGKTPKTSIVENYGGDIPFLTPSDDMNLKYTFQTARHLTDKGLATVKNSLLPCGAICVSCIGSDLGKVTLTTEPTVTNQQINSIIVDTQNYDTDFVYYAMKRIGKILNYHSKTSTAVPIVNKTAFSQYELYIPELSEQKKIASVLSSIDGKIDTNNEINKNLAA